MTNVWGGHPVLDHLIVVESGGQLAENSFDLSNVDVSVWREDSIISSTKDEEVHGVVKGGEVGLIKAFLEDWVLRIACHREVSSDFLRQLTECCVPDHAAALAISRKIDVCCGYPAGYLVLDQCFDLISGCLHIGNIVGTNVEYAEIAVGYVSLFVCPVLNATRDG